MSEQNGTQVLTPNGAVHGDRTGHRTGDRTGEGHGDGTAAVTAPVTAVGTATGADEARRTERGRFQRSDSDDPNRLVSIKVPAWLRDQLEDERQRIEPDPRLRRSMEFYASKALERGIDSLRSIQPIQDPLA